MAKQAQEAKPRTLEEIYGKRRANEIRAKMRASSYRKGKTWDEIYGPERAEELRAKWEKTRSKNWHVRGDSRGATYEMMYRERAQSIKDKISESRRGRPHSEEHKAAIAEGARRAWARRKAKAESDQKT